MRDRLFEAGVQVEYGVQVQSVEQSTAGCVARALGPDGQEIEIAAQLVIAADGARSTIRTMLDLPFDGVSYPEGWGLMDATLEWELPPDAVRIFRGDGPQQFVAVPLGGTRYRLQIDHRSDERQAAPPSIAEMQAVFDSYAPVPGTISAATWQSAFRVHRRQVVAYRSGRILLAGDAAHIHTPAGAQGLNTGIQDAINLGWKAALVVSGRAGPDLLDSYQDERQPVAAGVLHLAETLARNPDAMLAGDAVPPAIMSARVGQLLVNYRDGPLGQTPSAGSFLRAGDRLPDLQIGTTWLYRLLRGSGVTVAVFGKDTDVGDLGRWHDTVRLWQIDEVVDPNRLLADTLGLTTGAAIIRPDMYLGMVAEGSICGAAIDQWLTQKLNLRPAGYRPVDEPASAI